MDRQLAIIDQSAALERVGGDIELFQEIAEIFLDDCPRMMLAVQGAIQTRDGCALERAAHSLKGSVANFGAEAASAAAYQLEQLGRSGDLEPAALVWETLEEELRRFQVALRNLASKLGGA